MLHHYDDYEFEDLSIKEQKAFLDNKLARGEIKPTDTRFTTYEQRVCAWNIFIEKFKSHTDNKIRLEFFRELIKIDPFNAEELVNRGHIERAHYSTVPYIALDNYKAALQLDEKRVDLRVYINDLQAKGRSYYTEHAESSMELVRHREKETPTERLAAFTKGSGQLCYFAAAAYYLDAAEYIKGSHSVNKAIELLQKYNTHAPIYLRITNKNQQQQLYEEMHQSHQKMQYYYLGCAYNILGDNAKAISYFNTYLSSGDVGFYVSEAYYKRGLIYSKQDQIDLAIADFQKAGDKPLARIALRQERRKRNESLRKQSEKAEQERKLQEENIKQATKLEVDAVRANKAGNIDAVLSYCDQAISCCPQTHHAYLYKALIYIAKDDLAQATTHLNKLLQTDFKDEHVEQLANTLSAQQTMAQKALQAHKNWMVGVKYTICCSAIEGAINGLEALGELKLEALPPIHRTAKMSVTKHASLVQLITHILETQKVVSDTFSKHHKDVLIYKLSQILQAFFSVKKPSLFKSAPTVHFKVKDENIKLSKGAIDGELHVAITQAIGDMQRVSVPEGDCITSLIQRSSKIDKENISTLLDSVSKKYSFVPNVPGISIDKKVEPVRMPSLSSSSSSSIPTALPLASRPSMPKSPPSISSSNSFQAVVEEKDNKAKTSKDIASSSSSNNSWPQNIDWSFNDSNPWSQNIDWSSNNSHLSVSSSSTSSSSSSWLPMPSAPLAKLNSSTSSTSSSYTDTDTANLQEQKLIIEKEFMRKLAELKKEKPKTPTERSALNKKFDELEGKALEIKSSDFYIARGDFYYESIQKDTRAITKDILYNQALQNYRQALNYDPFSEEIDEKIEKVQTELKNDKSSSTLFAVTPAPKRETLSEEDAREVEKIKARLRQQQNGISTIVTLSMS